MPHLFELLSAYTKWRYQSLVVQRLVGIYISLRGSLSDQLREINFCRTRLVELQRSFDRLKGASEYIGAWTFQREIFPASCATLDAAVEQFAGQTAPEDLQELDRKVQYVIQQKFAALLHVCLSSANLLQDLEIAMQQEVEGFVSERLACHDVAALYLEASEPDRANCMSPRAAYTVSWPNAVMSCATDERCVPDTDPRSNFLMAVCGRRHPGRHPSLSRISPPAACQPGATGFCRPPSLRASVRRGALHCAQPHRYRRLARGDKRLKRARPV